MKDQEFFMKEALLQAEISATEGEVPVGAVIVHNEKIIGVGRNRRETNKNALAHAEIEAINEACRTLGGWRLPDCTMYVTMEPCPMCGGAIINSRIENVIYSIKDSKSGCFGSVLNFNTYPFNHKVKIEHGVCEKEASEMLASFFKSLREKFR